MLSLRGTTVTIIESNNFHDAILATNRLIKIHSKFIFNQNRFNFTSLLKYSHNSVVDENDEKVALIMEKLNTYHKCC